VKRLALFLDGTWDSAKDNTNVWRSQLLIADTDADGNAQEGYYETGVGTRWLERIPGGTLGKGIEEKVMNAYAWLMARYDEGDQISILGFSRGAFTARSLAGMIARCGLLRPGSPFPVGQIFERYHRGHDVPSLLDLLWKKTPPEKWTREDTWLVNESRRVDIDMIGVWDTVGALGIPFGSIPGLSRRTFRFLNTHPSTLYKHMYQALAIDENRGPYQATLWTAFRPDGEPQKDPYPGQAIEQRWFVGAHCNVGGGYRNDALAQLPLCWLLTKAEATGLRFKRKLQPPRDAYLDPVQDSYARFLFGVWRFLTLGRRHFRPIAADARRTMRTEQAAPGWSWSLNETIDASVFERWRAVPVYRPKNLADWGTRHGLDPAAVHGEWRAEGA
jgi:uncharacterized protein (DUF2235 family)